MTAYEKVVAAVQAYPEWSRAERAKLPAITDEILDHCANGTGNRFIREWCNRFLIPALRPFFSGPLPEAERVFPNTIREVR